MGMSQAERQKRHREKRLAEIESLPLIPCACGCGELIAPINKQLKPAKYKHGHNPSNLPKEQTPWNKGKKFPGAGWGPAGQKLPAEQIAKRTATRRINTEGKYTTGGYKHKSETIEKYKLAVRKRIESGEPNGFLGKTHTEETRQKLSKKLSGENNPNWNGGTATLPYGPQFTRKFKRLIRERDNYTCQRCGITQEEYGRTLQIHHLDHDKMNNDPSNLVTACGKCNVWASYHRDEPFFQT